MVLFDLYVKYIVAKEVFNSNEQSFPTGWYVGPGKYKVILVPVTRVLGGGSRGCSSDLTECEHYIRARLIDYNSDEWQPSSGMIIDFHVRTNFATWDEDRFF